jgi:predicted alpha/beta-hydrolase family hydrolase
MSGAMPDKTMRIAISVDTGITAVCTAVEDARCTFIYAPGAGSSLYDPFGAYAARALTAHGIATVRFQFPYMEAGRRGPDRTAVLEATWRAVIEAVRDGGTRLVVGGRSMGGRIASMVVAQGVAVDALALFAYPLHPPGKADQLRVAHFAAIEVPALFVSGTNDAFGSPDELRAATKKLKRSKLHLLVAADHGFAAPKSSERTRDDVYAEAVDAFTAWLAGIE